MTLTSQTKSHKRRRRSELAVAATVGNRIFNCGRWHLRATEIRQSRVVQFKSHSDSITSPSKKNKKRSSSPNPSQQSSIADNFTSITQIVTHILLSRPLMMSSSHGNTLPSIVLDDDDDITDVEMVAYILSKVDNSHMGPMPQRNGPLTGEYASGTFARGSIEGAPTFDEEREILRCRLKNTQIGEGSAKGKRKGDDSLDERSSKSSKMDSALEAWTATSRAREQYFENQVQSTTVSPQSDPYSVKECMNILQDMSFVDVGAKLKAISFFASFEWRQIFVEMEPTLRSSWLASL